MKTIHLDDAINFVQWLEEQLAPKGIHVGLTGSVLYHDQSDNDLDIILYPHNKPDHVTEDQMEQAVRALFPSAFRLNRSVTKTDYPASRQIVRVTELPAEGWKVDFFLMS